MEQRDMQATFCATLVDEWIAGGLTDAVVAPGSRSTPLALALADRRELALHVVHDERAAAFVALGLGIASGRPAILLCTSGTAAVNFHPAIVEAGLGDWPLLVATADRPPELRGVGAAQTIDQVGLYGSSVVWHVDAPVASSEGAGEWRPLAAAALDAARRGPAHLNLPFTEPLLGTPGDLPPPRSCTGKRSPTAGNPYQNVVDGVVGAAGDGVILAGGRSGLSPAAVGALAERLGWPVLADPLSGCRTLPQAITAFDALLRVEEFATTHVPAMAIRVGRPAASKVLTTWLVDHGVAVLQCGGPGVVDPDHNVIARIDDPAAIGAERSAPSPPEWSQRWIDANGRAESAIATALDGRLDEPAVARLVAEHRSADGVVVVASSMPVRDLEWYGGPAALAHANRGANGIDGVVSTALGIALTGVPVTVVVGDIAFLHDAGALTALAARDVDLRIVVVDNDGGGIFSFLAQATELAPERFERLFGTPHGTDVVAVAAAHGLDAVTVTSVGEFVDRLGRRGPTVTRVATDRAANVEGHRRLHDAVTAALRPSMECPE